MFRYLSRLVLLCALAALIGACDAASTPMPTTTAAPPATIGVPTLTPLTPTEIAVIPTASPTLQPPTPPPTSTVPALSGPYVGQIPPGLSPQVFAPGFISLSDSNEYSAAFSPDGSEFYFTRQFSNTQNIYETHLVEGVWSEPAPVAFTSRFGAHEPHLTLDNATLYFGWFRPVPAGETSDMDYGIWAVDRTTDGWSDPRYVGQGMYVSSDFSGQVYVTDLSASQANISLITLADGRFATWEAINAGAHPWIAPDGSYLIYDRDYGEHLFIRFRLDDGTWGEAIDLTGQGFPPEAGIASISPDGLYLFYTDGHDLYWVSTEIITALK